MAIFKHTDNRGKNISQQRKTRGQYVTDIESMEWGWKSKRCFVKKSFNQFCAVFEAADRYIGWSGKRMGMKKARTSGHLDNWPELFKWMRGGVQNSGGTSDQSKILIFPQFYGTVRRNVLIPIVVYPVTYWSSQCLCQLIVPTYWQ